MSVSLQKLYTGISILKTVGEEVEWKRDLIDNNSALALQSGDGKGKEHEPNSHLSTLTLGQR